VSLCDFSVMIPTHSEMSFSGQVGWDRGTGEASRRPSTKGKATDFNNIEVGASAPVGSLSRLAVNPEEVPHLDRRGPTSPLDGSRTDAVNRSTCGRELRIGVWNVESLGRGDRSEGILKRKMVVDECEKHHLDVLVLSDTRQTGETPVAPGVTQGSEKITSPKTGGDWLLTFAGRERVAKRATTAGVGFLLSPASQLEEYEFHALTARIAVLKLTDLIIVGCYAPTRSAEYPLFLSKLSEAYNKAKGEGRARVLIAGDLNAQVGDRREGIERVLGPHGVPGLNANGKRLLQWAAKCQTTILNTHFQQRDCRKYTWYRTTSSEATPSARGGEKSLIDLTMCPQSQRSCWRKVRAYASHSLSTDHNLVVAVLAGESAYQKTSSLRGKRKENVFTRIHYEKLNDAVVCESFQKALTQQQLLAETLEGKWREFKKAVVTCATKTCGVKTISTRKKQTPWWTKEVRKAVNDKASARAKVQADPTAENKRTYNRVSDAVKMVVADAKEKSWTDFGDFLERSRASSHKVFWSTLRRLRARGKSDGCEAVYDSRDNLVSQPRAVAEAFRGYFAELLNPRVNDSHHTGETLGDSHPVCDSPITLDEVQTAIGKLKKNKSAGEDDIRGEMLQALNPDGVAKLHEIISQAWVQGQVPQDWRNATIVPIFKKGNKKQCSNYRGISLLSVPGKVYARVLLDRLKLITDSLIDEAQAGFRTGRGVRDHLFVMSQILEKCYEFDVTSHFVFIDLEKAFDRVPRARMTTVLREAGVQGKLLQAVSALHEENQCRVRVRGHLSKPFTQKVGVRQGCVLAPALFTLYAQKIISDSHFEGGLGIGDLKISHLLYADDLVILSRNAEALQRNLNSFNCAAEKWGMKVNVDKTKSLTTGRGASRTPLTLNGNPIESVETISYLGMTISANRHNDDAITDRLSKGRTLRNVLYHTILVKKEITVATKLTCYQSLFVPTLTYGHEAWTLTKERTDRLKTLEMKFIRPACGYTLRDEKRNAELRETLGVKVPLVLRIERSQLRWLGHVIRMGESRLPKQILSANFSGRRPPGGPRKRFTDVQRDLLRRLKLTLEDAKVILSREDCRATWSHLCNTLPPRALMKGQSA